MLVLASASPRRAAILDTLGVAFRVSPTDVDESLLPGESGAEAAERLARRKAEAGRAQGPDVLAADTVVVCEGRVLGKPVSPSHAADMLRLLSGRVHQVVTGVCVASGGVLRSGRETTEVRISALSEDEIEWYVATGEPLDKAGAYHVDGKGSLFVEAVWGSPSNVAGLPVRLVRQLLGEAGIGRGLPRGR